MRPHRRPAANREARRLIADGLDPAPVPGRPDLVRVTLPKVRLTGFGPMLRTLARVLDRPAATDSRRPLVRLGQGEYTREFDARGERGGR